jgi:5'(3')-deoxyribonucleotidase
MDDVLTQTNQAWVDRYNTDWDDDHTLEDIKGWNFHIWVKPDCSYKVYDYLKEQGFYRSFKPVVGAIEGVRRLMDMGHDVVIATAAPLNAPLCIEEKKEWLREYMPWFNLANLFPIHRKELIRGDVLFDDGTHNLRDFKGISVCMDRPWNRGEDCCELRVSGWSAFLSSIELMVSNNKYMNELVHESNNRWMRYYFNDEEEEWRHEQH